ncbi:diacylglycerol kinase family protein [Marivirga harenae]|uniref:diacylglycerol/lipid kinase family protein n=1 Tax=Marivirga harenae TaxID=2010992 RepID=UPI0026DEC2DC|nr:diacylglycerol kinase family protein [Marivirga harenae]WKV13373.1 diacylglycerol kinase family lipid kinase [Marivirga harenae]|tara:strand:+ start:206575 stop:207453 length:879 start_codon:yes stop_codon:yes gene_type:complete
MQPKKLLFIINPKSGDNDKSYLERQIKSFCAKNNKDYAVFYTTGQNDLEKIKERQSEYKADTLVACGGDGTVNLIAQIVINSEIQLGIIPLGSANGLAYELEIEEGVVESLELILRGKTISMDAIRINEEFICLHLSDLGFNAKMIREFEESGERGMLAYAKAFFSSLVDKKTNEFRIDFNGTQQTIKAEMIVLANASSYGSGAVINPGSKLDDGTFELVVFKPIPLRDLLSLTLESFLGDIKNSPYVEIYRVEEARIYCHEAELLQVDGELKGDNKEVKAEVLKGAIKVIS